MTPDRMAAMHDYLYDLQRDADAPPEPPDPDLAALSKQGVTPLLAAAMLECPRRACIEDWAEAAALAALIEDCDVNRKSPEEMALARKQAAYARKLHINFTYLRRNLNRNLKRLHERREGKRRRARRPHVSLGTLTPEQRERAERLWANGPTGGLTWQGAMRTHARESPAVYRRVHRILHGVTGDRCQHERI